MLTGLDHVTIAVRDLDRAADRYERLLGAAPLDRAEHPELGTDSAIFGLTNTAIELVAPRGGPEGEGLRALLDAHGEGIQALAFATPDAAACSAALRGRGLRATAPEPGETRARDGSVRAYRTVELSARATRGLGVLAIERPDPQLLRAPGPPAACAMAALDHVVVTSSDPEAAIALYGEALGIRLALDRQLGGRRMLFFRIGGVTLEVVEDRAREGRDGFGGLAYRVGDIAAAHTRLRAAGFASSEPRAGNKPGTHVFTVRDGTCSVPTLVIRDPARD